VGDGGRKADFAVSDIDELPSWAPKSEQPEKVSAPTKTGGGGPGRGLLFALLALVALAVVAGGAFVLLSGGDDDTETATGDDAATGVTGTPPSTGSADTDPAGGGTEAGGEDAAAGGAETSEEGGDDPAAPTEPPADNSEGQIRHTEIRDGKFILNGTVPTQEMLDQIVAITANAAGAENVVNNLVLDPASPAQTTGYPVYIRDVVLFDVGSTEVREEFEPLLVVGAEFLKQNVESAITVIGHADSSGSPEANQRISEERAEAVKTIYVALGASPDQVFTIGKGEELSSEGANSSLQVEERRVEFYIGSVEGGPMDPE
jgi:outer membrane protein OmpA-like peptidoglycan-associated protein